MVPLKTLLWKWHDSPSSRSALSSENETWWLPSVKLVTSISIFPLLATRLRSQPKKVRESAHAARVALEAGEIDAHHVLRADYAETHHGEGTRLLPATPPRGHAPFREHGAPEPDGGPVATRDRAGVGRETVAVDE